jgi:hypothetical protein
MKNEEVITRWAQFCILPFYFFLFHTPIRHAGFIWGVAQRTEAFW